MNESQQLAKLWMTLEETKEQITNVAVPLGIHLGLNDPGLMIALEELSQRITSHFERFKLVAIVRHRKQG